MARRPTHSRSGLVVGLVGWFWVDCFVRSFVRHVSSVQRLHLSQTHNPLAHTISGGKERAFVLLLVSREIISRAAGMQFRIRSVPIVRSFVRGWCGSSCSVSSGDGCRRRRRYCLSIIYMTINGGSGLPGVVLVVVSECARLLITRLPGH